MFTKIEEGTVELVFDGVDRQAELFGLYLFFYSIELNLSNDSSLIRSLLIFGFLLVYHPTYHPTLLYLKIFTYSLNM